MTPEKMLDMARQMRGKIAPIEVYLMQDCDGAWWMVPVPNDDSSKWPTTSEGVKLPPLQPMKLERI